MPCAERFEKQMRRIVIVLPGSITKRVAVEEYRRLLVKYVGLEGKIVG
jgi:hypothetical protein